jgi:hypothetical protein
MNQVGIVQIWWITKYDLLTEIDIFEVLMSLVQFPLTTWKLLSVAQDISLSLILAGRHIHLLFFSEEK